MTKPCIKTLMAVQINTLTESNPTRNIKSDIRNVIGPLVA